jgi:carbamoyltransferase
MHRIIDKNQGEFFEFGHHLSHGANAFYTSDFDRALIVSIDSFGNEEGLVPSSMTIDEGINNKIKRIKIFDEKQVQIGRIYNLSTKWIFGLSVGYPNGDQAGSVMAMATLGEPKYVNLFSDYAANRDELIRLATLSEQDKFDVAASLQKYTEDTFYYHLARYVNGTTYENLCLSGGVSLNCVMLGKIKDWCPQFKNIFCDPVPYDAGLALGSARYLWHHVLGNPRIKNNPQNKSPYLGKIYSSEDIASACRQFNNKITVTQATDDDVLKQIAEQKIISVFGG